MSECSTFMMSTTNFMNVCYDIHITVNRENVSCLRLRLQLNLPPPPLLPINRYYFGYCANYITNNAIRCKSQSFFFPKTSNLNCQHLNWMHNIKSIVFIRIQIIQYFIQQSSSCLRIIFWLPAVGLTLNFFFLFHLLCKKKKKRPEHINLFCLLPY